MVGNGDAEERVRHTERTCIGCRSVKIKGDVVRVIWAEGLVIDYREKLPGRAAYVCPTRDCIEKGIRRDTLSRSFRETISPPDSSVFIEQLTYLIRNKMLSLLSMAMKSGNAAVGYSAARDALGKSELTLVLYARDLSSGTGDKLAPSIHRGVIAEHAPFSREELGKIFLRELVGIVGIRDVGIAKAIMEELKRLNGLIKKD